MPRMTAGIVDMKNLYERKEQEPVVQFWLPGQPPRKSNSRQMAKRKSKKTGRTYLAPIKSPEAQAWCESAAWDIPRGARLGLGSADAPLSIVFHVFYKTRKPDLSIELILDVLQKNGVISDDRHVYHYEAFKHFSKEYPGVFVQIYPYEYDDGNEFHGTPWSDGNA